MSCSEFADMAGMSSYQEDSPGNCLREEGRSQEARCDYGDEGDWVEAALRYECHRGSVRVVWWPEWAIL